MSVSADIHSLVETTVKKFKDIIMKNLVTNEENVKRMESWEEYCNPTQILFLVDTIQDYLENNPDKELSIRMATIANVFHYFQVVILETKYSDLLETHVVLNTENEEDIKQFHDIYNGFIPIEELWNDIYTDEDLKWNTPPTVAVLLIHLSATVIPWIN